MSGEAQRQKNMELGIRDIKAKVGEELKTVNIILHDFNPNLEKTESEKETWEKRPHPQEPRIVIKDGVRFVTHTSRLTPEDIAKYEAKKKEEYENRQTENNP